MKRFIPLAAILTFGVAGPALAAGETCNSFLHATTEKAMHVFHDKGSDVRAKRAALAGIFKQAVDTDWVGRYVLGRYWNTATPEQQQQYLGLYRNYLANSYVAKFDDDDGFGVSAIDITAFVPAADGFEAKSVIKSPGGDPDVHVDYLLVESGGGCRVHDVKIEGVSLLVSQRSEFGSVAAQGGIDKIIALMQARVKQTASN